ncbi:MAG: transposase family protein, partial [Limnohabitans sp.]|nr:transposase family protein [Limnohabitans sp.]
MNYQTTGLYQKKNEILSKIYFSPKNPASFSSVEKLYKAANEFIPISLNGVKKWLSYQNVYTLHKQRRRNFIRNKVIAETVNEQFQADIVDMQKFSRYNKGFKYILTVVDVLSKFAFAIPLKDKTSQSVQKAFEKIFKIRIPNKIQTDKGKEFINQNVQSLFKKHNIHYFSSNNPDIKCSNIERLNRTLKGKMWKYFTSKGSKTWIDVIDDIIDAYNNSIHSTTKLKPIDVNNLNQNIAFLNTNGFATLRDYLKSFVKKSLIKEGDS